MACVNISVDFSGIIDLVLLVAAQKRLNGYPDRLLNLGDILIRGQMLLLAVKGHTKLVLIAPIKVPSLFL